jgi:hypothetical protein
MLRANASNELHFTRPGSGIDTVLTVVHDDVAPGRPTVNPIASPTGSTAIVVAGTTEAIARMSVTGGVSTVTGTAGDDGRFSFDVTIAADATAMLSVIATDRAGNSSTPAVVSVTHSSSTPPAPILDEPAPPPTNTSPFTVTGRVGDPGPGINVRITGGASMAMGSADAMTGAFSIAVPLRLNMTNDLMVVSIEGAITSPPALATVVHDDTPPAAPDTSRISSDAPSVCLVRGNVAVVGTMGAVEGRARVAITNMATSTTVNVNATDGGSFTVNVASCPGDILRITATDAAGNVSPASEETVI